MSLLRELKALSPLIIAAATALGCAPDPAKRDLDIVRVARSNLLSNAPIVIGNDEGYFAREGIALEYVRIPSFTVQALPGLQEGDVDVVSAAVTMGLINAIGGGATFKIVADRGHYDPRSCEPWGIIGRRALFGDKAVDANVLRGTRVSIFAVGQSGYLMSKFLGKYGLKLSDVKVVRLPASVELQAMEKGTIDIVARGDPLLYAMLDAGHRLLAGATTLAPGSHLGVLVFGPTLLSRDRDLGLRFMKAYLRGVRKYSEGRTPRNVAIVSKRLGLDSVALRKMCWPSTRGDGAINQQSLAEYQKWAVESGELKEVIDPAVLVDTTFAAQASAALDAESRAR